MRSPKGLRMEMVTSRMAEHEPILVDANDAAAMLGVSRAHFYRMRAAGQVPLPVRLGKAVRWRVEELQEWVDAGCPGRSKWEAIKAERKSS